jgi:hypothetical protein
MVRVTFSLAEGCRTNPKQASPAGNPEPAPDPIAPKPIQIPAEKSAKPVMIDGLDIDINRMRTAITRAKIDEDSAIACPISIDFNTSPDIFGDRDIAAFA